MRCGVSDVSVCSRTFTKLDWLCWVAALGSDAHQQKLLHSAYLFAKESPSRMPLSDLYYTDTSASLLRSVGRLSLVGCCTAQ